MKSLTCLLLASIVVTCCIAAEEKGGYKVIKKEVIGGDGSSDYVSIDSEARRAYITPQSMNEVVLQLERRGLLKRRPDPAHRRILRATVTARGRSVLGECEAAVAGLEETMLAALDDEGRDRIVHYLAACVHALGAGLPDLE